eukprot:6211933-Pleurochrysis_carterae.AAC.1
MCVPRAQSALPWLESEEKSRRSVYLFTFAVAPTFPTRWMYFWIRINLHRDLDLAARHPAV